jgi:hypothetical protein
MAGRAYSLFNSLREISGRRPLHAMSLVYGLAGVAAYILTGYLKSGEAFNPVKALKTLILAALIIALNTAAGVELPAEELAALLNAGELALLENLLKTLWRRLFSGI